MAEHPASAGAESPAAQLKRSAKTAAAWFWANVTAGAFGVWAIGEVFKDMHSLTAICFLVPTSLSAAALLIAALFAFACGCRRVALAAAVLWLFPTFWLLFVENHWVRPSPRGDPARALHLVHWNVGPIANRAEEIVRFLKPLEADAYILSEMFNRAVSAQVAAALGSDYTMCHERQIAVFARGRLSQPERDEAWPSHVYCFAWESSSGRLKLMTVDLPSRPFYSRAPWLQRVHERIAYLKPDLVVGDFNARRRAHWLGTPPKGYAHAYGEAGKGWSYSWPDAFPLWDIDQCIIGPRVRAIRYELMPTGASDHRLQWLEFSIAHSPQEPSSVP